MKAAACALVVATVLSTTAAVAQTGTVSDFTAGLVPAGKNGPDLVVWQSAPTKAEIKRVFPRGATYTGYMLWQCQASATGSLTDCDLVTQWPPNDERYKAAAEKLLPIFRVDAHTAELAGPGGKKILFDLPVYRDGSKSFPPGECPPPFCVPVLPPPPPPVSKR